MATKRRSRRGEGSVYERKDKRWAACLSIDGRPRYRYAPNRADALQELASLRLLRDTGRFVSDSKQTLRQLLDSWLVNIVEQPGARYATVRAYRHDVERICRHVGGLKLNALSAQRIQCLYTELAASGLSAATIQHGHIVLKMALKQAVAWNLIPYSPANDVKPPKSRRAEIDPLTRDELQALLNEFAGSRWYALFDLLGTTGLRISEALGLQWKHVDWTVGSIRIEEALQYRAGNGFWFVPLKSDRSRREIRLSTGTLRALEAHRAIQRAEWLASEEKHKKDLVFSRANGLPLHAKTAHDVLQRVCDQAGIKRIRVHDLRHTAATLMLRRLPVHQVSKILGHASASVTLNVYAHVLPDMNEEAAQMWDELLERA